MVRARVMNAPSQTQDAPPCHGPQSSSPRKRMPARIRAQGLTRSRNSPLPWGEGGAKRRVRAFKLDSRHTPHPTLSPWRVLRNADNRHCRRPGRPQAERGSNHNSISISACCEQIRPRLEAGAASEYLDGFLIRRGLQSERTFRPGFWRLSSYLCADARKQGFSDYWSRRRVDACLCWDDGKEHGNAEVLR